MDIKPLSEIVETFKDRLDVFFPKLPDGFYHAVCLNNGFIGPKCPNNIDSICTMACPERPRDFYHAWDGKNAWKCPCG